MWSALPLLERIEAAAGAGFKAVELHWPYDTEAHLVRERCERLGLQLLSVNTPVGERPGDGGLAAQIDRQTEFKTVFEQTLRWAVESGASMIHVLPGSATPDSPAKAQQIFLDNLAWASDLAAAQEITLLLEAINPRDKPGYYYHQQAESMAVIDALRSQYPSATNVKLMFDVYHVGVAEGDVLKKLAHYLPHIGHIQIASVPNRAEPDEGEIRFEAVFQALMDLDYGGWIGCEYRPRGDAQEGLKWVTDMGLTL